MSNIDLEPRKVFQYFEEISRIPHGSYNTEAIAQYLVDFARERDLEVKKDQAGNVAIFKAASPGYEKAGAVILQGHMDMVCEKEADCGIDMQTEGIKLVIEGDYLTAEGTTLGGDDGIALAYILAILDDDTLDHPAIEALITTNEEVGLAGASAIDIPGFTAKRLINLDSEEEGVLTVSCAGAVRAKVTIPLSFEEADPENVTFLIRLSHLQGGHSGIDIGKKRVNAVTLLGRIITELSLHHQLHLAEVSCPGRENVIPQKGFCKLVCSAEDANDFMEEATSLFMQIYEELEGMESDITFEIEQVDSVTSYLSQESGRKLAFAMYHMPNGVIMENPEIPGMIRTSSNIGNLTIEEGKAHFGIMVRSNMDCEKEMMIRRLTSFASFLDGSVSFANSYPAWQYRSDSPLRDLMVGIFEEQFGRSPEISSIHAGLECGILSGRLGEMDMISIGPELLDVHSPKERMGIPSVQRTWEYLIRVLKAMKN